MTVSRHIAQRGVQVSSRKGIYKIGLSVPAFRELLVAACV
jgi:hypothetical protein